MTSILIVDIFFRSSKWLLGKSKYCLASYPIQLTTTDFSALSRAENKEIGR